MNASNFEPQPLKYASYVAEQINVVIILCILLWMHSLWVWSMYKLHLLSILWIFPGLSVSCWDDRLKITSSTASPYYVLLKSTETPCHTVPYNIMRCSERLESVNNFQLNFDAAASWSSCNKVSFNGHELQQRCDRGRWCSGDASDLHWLGAGFESLPSCFKFLCFSQSLHTHCRIDLKFGHYSFLSYPFQFIIRYVPSIKRRTL